MRDLQSVVADLLRLMATRETSRIAPTVAELFLTLGVGDHLTSEEYNAFTELIQAPEVIASDQSHRIYAQIQYLWDELTPEQRRHITSLLEKLYPTLKDWVAQLVITDVLGVSSEPESGLAALRRLRKINSQTPRALVANGFGQLAKYSPSAAIARGALEELLMMLEDTSPRVRDEARDVLGGVNAVASSTPDHPLSAIMKREVLGARRVPPDPHHRS